MSNAPPTPPPDSAPAQVQPVSNPAPTTGPSDPGVASQAHDAAQPQAFPVITTLASQGNWKELIETAEEAELIGTNGRPHLLITIPLILAYLITDKLIAAKHAYRRLSNQQQTHPLAVELMKLVNASLERRHALVYSMSEKLYNQTAQASPDDQALANVVAAMLTAFVDVFRSRTVALLSKAYLSIPLPLAQSYFGLPQDQLLIAAEKYNWAYDSSSQILYPKPIGATSQLKDVPVSDLSTFEYITNSVVNLEA